MKEHLMNFPEMMLIFAVVLQAVVIYYHAWRTRKLLGLKPGLDAFRYYAIGFTTMMVPRFILIAYVGNLVPITIQTVILTCAFIYVFDSLMFLLAGKKFCNILASVLVHPIARAHAVEAAKIMTGKTEASAAHTLGEKDTMANKGDV
jgi:hypothetical protein